MNVCSPVSAFKSALLAGLVVALIPLTGLSGPNGRLFAQAETDTPYFSMEEVKFELAMERDLHHFNRLSGLMTDLLKAQRKLFSMKREGESNEVGDRVEDLINDAGLLASQQNYDDSFVTLENAFNIITTSLKAMGASEGKL